MEKNVIECIQRVVWNDPSKRKSLVWKIRYYKKKSEHKEDSKDFKKEKKKSPNSLLRL